jgi:hypothetical protein
MAGISAAFSPAFWQFGLIFPFLIVGIGYDRKGLKIIYRIIVGMIITTLVVLLPIFLWGGLSEMVASVILVPIYAS